MLELAAVAAGAWALLLAGQDEMQTSADRYCVGCCWGLMAVLVGAAAMAPAWAALIALIVFVEKVLPRSIVAARALGVVVVVAGAAYGLGS